MRWILLGAGLLVVLVVYLLGRRRTSDAVAEPRPASDGRNLKEQPFRLLDDAEESQDGRIAPSLGGSGEAPAGAAGTDQDRPVVPGVGEQIDIEDAVEAAGDEPAAEPPQKIVTVRIVAGDADPIAGDKIVLGLRGIGMRHGRFGIFHQYDGDDESRVVFSAASLVEPGSFELENLKEQRIPGISLFAVLPGPVEGAEAFDRMMTAARTLAKSLDAEMLDESGSSLSIQRERYLREEIIQFQLSNRLS